METALIKINYCTILSVQNGEFIAIFDADFLPNKDFLKNTIGHFKDEKIAVRELVQLGKVRFMTLEEAQSSTNRNIFEVYTFRKEILRKNCGISCNKKREFG